MNEFYVHKIFTHLYYFMYKETKHNFFYIKVGKSGWGMKRRSLQDRPELEKNLERIDKVPSNISKAFVRTLFERELI